MNCPTNECDHKIKESDFKINIYEDSDEIEVVYTCPECGLESILGFGVSEL